MKNTIGKILKKWRTQARYSQFKLAIELDVSSKHISFIETGRSLPSKEMILKICEFLQVPKGEINRTLNIAGYAPIYAELSSSDKSLEPVFDAIDNMIQSHMPYPALVLNQYWDVVNTNDSAKSLLESLGYSEHTNLVEALISDNPKTSKIINWHETVSSVATRLRQENSLLGSPQRLQELENKLSDCLQLSDSGYYPDTEEIVISTKIKLNNKELSYFSIIAQLGTVQDVTVSEYKVELMFPANTATKKYYISGAAE